MFVTLRYLVFIGFFFSAELHAASSLAEFSLDDTVALRAEGWQFPVGARIETLDDGGRALKITAKGERAMATWLFPVSEGKSYRCAVDIQTQGISDRDLINSSDRGATVFLEFRDAEKQWVRGGAFPRGLYGTHPEWRRFAVPYTNLIPPGVAYIALSLVVESEGTAWFRELKVEEVPLETQSEITDRGDIELRWSLALPYEVELSNHPSFPNDLTRRFSSAKAANSLILPERLSDGQWFWRTRVFAEASPGQHPPTFLYPVDSFLVGAADVKMDAQNEVIKHSPNESVWQKLLAMIGLREPQKSTVPIEQTAFEPESATAIPSNAIEQDSIVHSQRFTLDADGFILDEGKRIFPLGTYRDPSDKVDDFAGTIEAGFNLTHDYSFEEKEASLSKAQAYLDNANANGLSVFMGMPRSWVNEHLAGEMRAWVAGLANHRALLTFYLYDEPEIHANLFPPRYREAVDIIRTTSPNSLVSAVFTAPSPIVEYFIHSGTDIPMFDPYPIGNSEQWDTMRYDQQLKANRAMLPPGSPYWVVIQGHDLGFGFMKLPPAGQIFSRPRPEETRFMAHLAIANGATGLIWYWGPQRWYDIRNDTPHIWKGIADTVRELRDLTPFLVQQTKPSFSVPEVLRFWYGSDGEKSVLSLINPTTEPVTFPANPEVGIADTISLLPLEVRILQLENRFSN